MRNRPELGRSAQTALSCALHCRGGRELERPRPGQRGPGVRRRDRRGRRHGLLHQGHARRRSLARHDIHTRRTDQRGHAHCPRPDQEPVVQPGSRWRDRPVPSRGRGGPRYGQHSRPRPEPVAGARQRASHDVVAARDRRPGPVAGGCQRHPLGGHRTRRDPARRCRGDLRVRCDRRGDELHHPKRLRRLRGVCQPQGDRRVRRRYRIGRHLGSGFCRAAAATWSRRSATSSGAK